MNRCYLVLLVVFFAISAFASTDSLLLQQIEKADSLRSIGKSNAALILLNKKRNDPIFSQSSCSSKATFYHKIGLYYYDLYKSKEALTYWQDSSLQIRLTCLGRLHEDTANSYFGIAMAFRDLEDKKKEGENILRAIDILESLPEKDTIGLAYNYLQVGILYDELGDYELAENYLLHAQQFYQDLDIRNNRVAELLKSLGLLKIHQEQYKEAKNYFQLAIEMYEQIKGRNNELDIADCYQNLGRAYFHQKNYSAANKNVLIALKEYQELTNNAKISKSYELLGIIRKRQKDYPQALNYFKESLRLRKELSQKKDVANAYENIADIFAEQNQYEQALKNYDTSISYLLPDFKKDFNQEKTSLQYELALDKVDLLRVISLKAETLLARHRATAQQADLLNAYSLHQQLDTLIVKIRQQYKTPGSKFFLAQKTFPIYESAIKTALELFEQSNAIHYLEEAYVYCAKNKAIVLLDGIQDLNAKFVGVPEDLIAKEKELKKEHALLEGKIFSYISQEGQDSLLEVNKSQYFKTRRELEKLVSRLEKEYPKYYDLKYAVPDLSTIKTLQDSLSADQAIIEYFVGNQQVFVFTILNDKINYKTIAKPKDFNENCELFREFSSGTLAFEEGQFRLAANSLFNLLLKYPLSTLDKEVSRLIVIPDDLLLSFSFDNLLYEESVSAAPFPYLIKKYAISTAYSNQLLFQDNILKSKKSPDNLFGGFGLEYNDFTLEGLNLLSSIQNSSNANRETAKLIYSDDEVKEIAALLKGKAWTNEEARKSNFLENAGKFRILHFAMHGIIDEEKPLNSSLIFYRESDSTDFQLRASELYPLELNAELVVLSACHTGAGKIAKGEGVRSLSRAFAYTGSPALVTSLWSASDYSTKEILVPFYQNLYKGMPKDVALQQAKLEYLEKTSPSYALPAYWSHLSVVGNTEPIVFELLENNWRPWIIAGTILIALFFIKKLMVRK